ncbi:hypothetical protein RFI_36138 [Reticulomyxa filosa]|uniref:Secreted protein n=1 Tax=Reticulomyxa filosa TaxID=46433 RepID=X6LJI4_RETFI|nr:hypothetical protein RFI_36138 [Reticulomyxa filosa]|eukprot:ETO01302.1 hypothetical protein RFI_36138 [Reticulomyxa filosa]
MKPSLVYEIVLILLQVLTAVLAMSSASNVAKENSKSNSNDTIYSNNQDRMCTSLLSLNKLSNHSSNRMWKSKTLKCVQCPQYFDNATEMSVQLKYASIRIIKMTTVQSKNIYTKTPAIDMFTTSSISSTYFKSKYSVCAGIEVDVVVIVISAPPSMLLSSTRATLQCTTIRYFPSRKSIGKQYFSNTFRLCSFFFYDFFFKHKKKKLGRSYDLAQKKNIDDMYHNDGFDTLPN